MKLTTTKEQVLNAVLLAERITGKKESLPILSCVLLEAAGSLLVVRGTNLEAGIEVAIPGKVEAEGSAAVPAVILSQTLRSIGGDSVTFGDSEGNLSVESRGSKNLIKAIPHEEFPSLSRESKHKGFPVSREQLMHGIQSVVYAASPSMIRPELGSVYIAIEQGAITCVATDSFRLAEKKVSGAAKKESSEILVPLKHAGELLFVLERMSADEVHIAADDAQLTVSGGGVRFVSRAVDAQFPNYKEIIPRTFATEATLLKNDLAEVLRKARVFSGAESQVGFHIYPKRKIFTAIARSADIGEMSDSLDAALSGEDLDINFHIGYLADCLPSIAADSVVLGFAGAGKPLVIRPVSDQSFMYLVMPLNR